MSLKDVIEETFGSAYPDKMLSAQEVVVIEMVLPVLKPLLLVTKVCYINN